MSKRHIWGNGNAYLYHDWNQHKYDQILGGDQPVERGRNKITHRVSKEPWVPCWVYVVTDGAAIKIGSTVSVKRRLAELNRQQRPTAQKLEILVAFEGTRADETMLHAMFARHRIGGEWFAPHAEIIEVLVAMLHTLKYRVHTALALIA